MFKRAGNMIGFAFKTLWLSSGFLPQASPQTESERSPADQHDHGRAARHVPQRAGHVALPALSFSVTTWPSTIPRSRNETGALSARGFQDIV